MRRGPDGRYPDERERWERALAGGQAALNRYYREYIRRVHAAEARSRQAAADEEAAYRRSVNAARMWRVRHPEEAASLDAERPAHRDA